MYIFEFVSDFSLRLLWSESESVKFTLFRVVAVEMLTEDKSQFFFYIKDIIIYAKMFFK